MDVQGEKSGGLGHSDRFSIHKILFELILSVYWLRILAPGSGSSLVPPRISALTSSLLIFW